MNDHTQPVSVDAHLARILGAVHALRPDGVPVPLALGRVLAGELIAQVDVPSFDNSAMDGYALRSADAANASDTSPAVLRVVADLPAGSAEDPALASGEAARIMTGAPLPADADCIVPVEDTDGGQEVVRISIRPQPGAHVRRAGTDVRAGDVVLPAGVALGPRSLAAAAAVGLSEVPVHRAPRVAVLSTGSELVPLGAPLGRGQIHDSNSHLLAAAVERAGGIPVWLGAISDDEPALRAAFARHEGEVDAFVTSGGVSVGAYDVVKAVLAPLGVWFGPVRMQPGKPQGFGAWRDGAPIFALPGNPVSAFVSFEVFVWPALRAMQGYRTLHRSLQQAIVAEGWRSPAGKRQFMPIVLADGTIRPASRGGAGSYLVANLASANALAVVPEDVTHVAEGDQLDVMLLDS